MPEVDREQLGARIRSLRRDRDLSQEQLAGAIGVSAQVVHNWERGHSGLPADELPTIANRLGVDISELFEERAGRNALKARLDAIARDLRRALELAPERIEVNVYVSGAEDTVPARQQAGMPAEPPSGLRFTRQVLQAWPDMEEAERQEWRDLAAAITAQDEGRTE